LRIYRYVWDIRSRFEKKRRQKYVERLVSMGLQLGKNVEIIDSFFFDPSHCFLISIGDNCTICPNVRLIAHDASTKRFLGYTKIGRIDIGENCFIGDSAIILPGVTIGPNAIVGAGAVVTRQVPPGTVVAGAPARVIGKLDDYLGKVEGIRKAKKVFDESYYIENLTEEKRRELLDSIGSDFALIV